MIGDWRKGQNLDHLERQRQLVNERLEREMARINAHFDRAEAQISRSLNSKQERIIEAALKVLDSEGLDSLSLRKLAGLIDMQAPAIYWHFKSKELLIDYMAEAILQSEFGELTPRGSDEAWQDWLVKLCIRLRKAMKSRRDGARIVAGAHLYPAVTLMKIFDVSQESLISAGLDDRRADLLVSTAVHFTFGRVIEEQASPTPEHMEHVNIDDFRDDYPHIAKSMERYMEDQKNGYDEFEDALRLIVGYA